MYFRWQIDTFFFTNSISDINSSPTFKQFFYFPVKPSEI